MNIEFEVLEFKQINETQWVLCGCNLHEYLSKLKPQFYQYIIQRKIVKNKYLNTLVNTIMTGEPVPLITLTTSKEVNQLNRGQFFSLDMETVEILDGLQRTFRLWAYFKIIHEHKSNLGQAPVDFAKKIKSLYPEFFDSGIITLTRIKEYYKDGTFLKIEEQFKKYEMYFILWGSLTSKKAIHKMLVLNAGQKPVSVTHQYELLFLYVWEEIAADSKIKLYRERDPQANKIKAGERNIGEFMFSSVIAGLRSFLENKPKKISIDDFDIEDLQQAEFGKQINEDVFTKPYLQSFLNKLISTDNKVYEIEKENGKKWFVRDTTLSGILAGLGKYIGIKETMPIDEIDRLTIDAFDNLITKIESRGFNLDEFFREYYSLQSKTVNVGTYVRAIIMDYTYNLLSNESTNWEILFSKSKTN